MTRLTEHFTLEEFYRAADGIPGDDIVANLLDLATALEGVRERLSNRPIIITSGYRTPAHNIAVGGVPWSYHLRGMAADFVALGMRPRDVQEKLTDWPGGMGCYVTFTHLDIRPYRARF